MNETLVTHPVSVLAVLLTVLATLFAFQRLHVGKRIYKVVPILVFCYFVPTALSNTGVIPNDGKYELYVFIKDWLLPVSLFLLVLAVDIPQILRLGPSVLILFGVAFSSIVLGGPLAYLALGWMLEPEATDQAWKGLAALSGSWIGGGANMTAIKESVGASDSILGAIVVVDVFVAELWTAVLFYFAGRELRMDESIGARREKLDRVREAAAAYQSQVAKPTNLTDLLGMLALAFGATVISQKLGDYMVEVMPDNKILGSFTWTVIWITFFGLLASFTPLRRLEGTGASAVGSVLLYLLVASIGAKAHFATVVQKENLPLVAIGGLWMILHATTILLVRRWIRAPIFFAAISSRSLIGGAASAPIVAAAFNPALVPVGVLLAIFGYVVGTWGGVLCALLLEQVQLLVYAPL